MKLLLHARRGHSQAAPIPLFLRLAQPCAVLASCVHAPVCFRVAAWSLPHGLPSLVVSKGGAAIADPCCTQILHCYCIPTKLQWGLLPVYRLHALHAGTALVIAYLCCRRDLLPLSRGNRSLRAGASCFSFLRNMLCDEGTICLRKECRSELLLETEFLVQT